MIRDTEDVVARVAAAIREALNEQGGGCAEALQDGKVVPDTGIYWFYGHQIDIPAIARAALKASDRQSLSDRIDVLEGENEALRAKRKLKIVPAPPVVFEDETRAALHQEGIAP